MKDILERKWNSVVKLKRQVIELEKQVKELKDNMFGGGSSADASSNRAGVLGDGLPK